MATFVSDKAPKRMINFPNAKINIGLNILEKRKDGYHNISSIFYPIGWKDALEVASSESFQFESSGLTIPGSTESNLIIKAYHLLKPYLKTKGDIRIHLHKVIPMGAGLGGGSADGAFALTLLNEFFKLNLNTTILQELAGKLGSDCPFFIKNEAVYCYNRGMSFKDISLDLSSYHLVVVNPNIHISTAEAYGAIKPKHPDTPLLSLVDKPIELWKEIIVNDFEEPLAQKYPIIGAIKAELYEHDALYASMTGSGSTLYGIFKEPIDLKGNFEDFAVWQGKML